LQQSFAEALDTTQVQVRAVACTDTLTMPVHMATWLSHTTYITNMPKVIQGKEILSQPV
jgi:hypothetical protein